MLLLADSAADIFLTKIPVDGPPPELARYLSSFSPPTLRALKTTRPTEFTEGALYEPKVLLLNLLISGIISLLLTTVSHLQAKTKSRKHRD
jgi:hypothetical protein